MFWFLFIIGMGVLSRLSGNGFGAKWGVSWLPELLFSLPFGVATGWALSTIGGDFLACLIVTSVSTAISYAGMQAATWTFLRWESHDGPNTERSSTLKPIVDWLASRWGYKLGDEGYSWVAAAVKGFIIGFPVGAIPLMMLWPLGYEIGSHAKGRVERFGLDPHAISEFMAGVGAGVAITLFVFFIKLI